MRPIDADALNEKLCETTIFIKDGEVFQRMINDAPTIDAVQVVRCKDCLFSEIFQNDSSGVMTMYCRAFTFERMVAEDDYCSYGERREDGEA